MQKKVSFIEEIYIYIFFLKFIIKEFIISKEVRNFKNFREIKKK